MGLWWVPLADMMSKKAQTDLVKAVVDEMQKGNTTQSMILYGMIVFAAMLSYVLIDAKRQASKLRAKIDEIQEKFSVGVKEQYEKDLVLVQSTTEAIATFNAKFPDLMNFVRTQSSLVEALTPKVDGIAKQIEKLHDNVADVQRRLP